MAEQAKGLSGWRHYGVLAKRRVQGPGQECNEAEVRGDAHLTPAHVLLRFTLTMIERDAPTPPRRLRGGVRKCL